MTRLQRAGLLAILGVTLLLQMAVVEVLMVYGPVHIPIASRIMIALALIGGGAAWLWEPGPKEGTTNGRKPRRKSKRGR
jgi:hypothetical protein